MEEENESTHEKIISLDAETNGLWGDAFSVAFVKYDEHTKESERIAFRCPIEGEVNEWVAEKVIPQMEGIPITHDTREEMLEAIGEWWMANKDEGTPLWHMGHVVEAKLFRDLVEGGHIGEWDAPYCPIEVSQSLKDVGMRPDSVDEAMITLGIEAPEVEGGTHNPLYDSLVSAEVYFALERIKREAPSQKVEILVDKYKEKGIVLEIDNEDVAGIIEAYIQIKEENTALRIENKELKITTKEQEEKIKELEKKMEALEEKINSDKNNKVKRKPSMRR